MHKLLIVEDEEAIAMALEDQLQMAGFETASVGDGRDALGIAAEEPFDLILLDVMLPGLDGFEVCKRLRAQEVMTPIIMLTAKSQEIDKVLGLEFGADDYVTKPFSPRELLARIKANLRRSGETPASKRVSNFGNVTIDFDKYEVEKNGESVYLTSLEFALIGYLIHNEARVVGRDAIIDGVWGDDVYVVPKTVDTHVGRLRKKLEDDPARPKHIIGVRGVGYRFDP